jgi:hypothetical protein
MAVNAPAFDGAVSETTVDWQCLVCVSLVAVDGHHELQVEAAHSIVEVPADAPSSPVPLAAAGASDDASSPSRSHASRADGGRQLKRHRKLEVIPKSINNALEELVRSFLVKHEIKTGALYTQACKYHWHVQWLLIAGMHVLVHGQWMFLLLRQAWRIHYLVVHSLMSWMQPLLRMCMVSAMPSVTLCRAVKDSGKVWLWCWGASMRASSGGAAPFDSTHGLPTTSLLACLDCDATHGRLRPSRSIPTGPAMVHDRLLQVRWWEQSPCYAAGCFG